MQNKNKRRRYGFVSETWLLRLKRGLSITSSTCFQFKWVSFFLLFFFFRIQTLNANSPEWHCRAEIQPVLNQHTLYIFTVSLAGLRANLYFNRIRTAGRFPSLQFRPTSVGIRRYRKTYEPTAKGCAHVCRLYASFFFRGGGSSIKKNMENINAHKTIRFADVAMKICAFAHGPGATSG